MENIRYDLKKALLITLIFFSLRFLFLIYYNEFSLQFNIKASLITGTMGMLAVWFVVHSLNKGKKHGLSFSESALILTYDGKRYPTPWNEVEVSNKFKISNFFYIISFSIKGYGKKFNYLLYTVNSKSFSELVKKYAPKDHAIRKLNNDYLKINN